MLKNASYTKKFWLLTLSLSAIRLILASIINLVPQEAYYWLYIQKPDFGYFDHPPMCAYSIGIFTYLFGNHEIFVRLGTILFSIGTAYFVFKLAQKLYNEKVAFFSAVFLNLTLFFNMQGSMISTPDAPLLFFWALTVYSLYKTFFEDNSVKNWALSGLFGGFALFSKYTAVFLFLSAFIFLIMHKEKRKMLLSYKPFVAIITAVIGFFPVIYWNIIHSFASFKFQSATRAKGMTSFTLNYFFQLIGSQLLELTPLFFALFIYIAFRISKKSIKERDEKALFLTSFSIPYLVFFIAVSFTSLVKMNWLLPAYLTLMIAFANLYSDKLTDKTKDSIWLKFGLVLSGLMILAFIVMSIIPLAPNRGDTWNGWKEFAVKIDSLKLDMDKSNKTFIFSDEYKVAAELSFYTKHKSVILAQNTIGETALQFDYWQNPNDYKGWDAILTAADFNKHPDIDKVSKYFERVEEVPSYKFESYGRIFRTFWIYKCFGYKGRN